jgi:hypothetical protein
VDNPADIGAQTMLHPLWRKHCKGFGEELIAKNV